MYEQIQTAKRSIKLERGLFSSTTSYTAPFVPFEGVIPFYPPTLFGTPPSIAVRMPTTTWSDAINIQNETLTAGLGRHISLQELQERPDGTGVLLRRRNEVGVHVHKGSGTLEKVTIMTLVPRFILVCKLSQPIQVAQVRVVRHACVFEVTRSPLACCVRLWSSGGVCGFQLGMTNGPYLVLKPGEIAPFHWAHADHARVISIRYHLLPQGLTPIPTG